MSGPAEGLQIKFFDFFPGPWGFAQKLEAGLDAGLEIEAADVDDASQLEPAVMLEK